MMANDATAETGGGNILCFAGTNVAVGVLDARTSADRASGSLASQANWGAVGVTAAAGSILESSAPGAATVHIYGSATSLAASNAIGGYDVREYRLQYSVNLTTWTDLATIITPDAQITFIDPAPAKTMRFYRVITSDSNIRLVPAMPVFLPDGTVKLSWTSNYVSSFAGANVIALETDKVAANSGAGGINLLEASDVTVSAVAVSVNRVTSDGGIVAASDSGSDLTTYANGSVVFRTINGSIVLNDTNGDLVAVSVNGAGNAHIAAGGAGDVVANSDIITDTGHVTVISAQNVRFNRGAEIRTAAAGTINVEAGGSVVMDDTSLFIANSGDIRVAASANVTLGGLLTTGNVAVAATNGWILDGGDTFVDIVATAARLNAGMGVGTLGSGADNPIEITVATVSARAGAGGVNLLETDTLMVGDVSATVRKVLSAGTLLAVTEATQSDVVTVRGNGSIVLQTVTGALTLNDGTAAADGVAVRADGSGNIRLFAGGGADVVLNGDTVSAAGNISVLANSITFGAFADVRTGGTGTADLEAFANSVLMAGSSVIETAGGNIRVKAAQNVTIGLLDARTPFDRASGTVANQANWGNVSVLAIAGTINEADSSAAKVVDVYGNAGRFVSAISVGLQGLAPNPLETELATISINTGSGGLNVLDLTALATGSVNTVPANRVLPDGTVALEADDAVSTGNIKTGGTATIASDQNIPILNYPKFDVVSVLTTGTAANSLTGLYEQVVQIANPTGSTVDAVRIVISNLPSGVQVVNAAGTIGGLPYVLYNLPLAAGQTVNIVIEYYAPSPQFIPTSAVFLPQVVLAIPDPNPVGILITDLDIFRNPARRNTVVFSSLWNRTYYMQFSDDGTNWKTVLSPIIGTGRDYVWIDSGPPKTDSDSVGVIQRYYRLVLTP
jgi:hypothetical protein